MAILSVVILGERFRMRRWAAIILGFVGVLIVLRPGLIPVDLGSSLALAAAMHWAVAMILIKVLSRTEPAIVIVFYMNLFLSAFTFVPAMLVWQNPSLEAWGWLVAIGLMGTLAQVSLSQSLKETEPTAVLPFDFLKLIWVSMLAYWLFAETPDAMTWLGAAVIFGSGFYLAWRERQLRQAE
jgi:drug/metabolite transporter (DMT)-like permease